MIRISTFAGLAGTVITALLSSAAVAAPDIPCSTVRLIVPYGAGGGSDLQARVIADAYNRLDVQPKLQVINITGQGGNRGASEVANADPDGCTLLFQHEAILASYLTGRVAFSWDGFSPVAMTNVEPAIFAASPDAPFDDLDSLISYAKEHPGDVLAAASIASNTHFIILQFQETMDVEINVIGYEGGRERMTALLSDTVQLGQVGESDAQQYFPNQLKALAIFAPERSGTLPDVPTAAEQGYDLEIMMARGMLLPKDASQELVALYADRFEQAMQDPVAVEALSKMGNAVRFLGPQDYSEWWGEQASQWEKVARDIGIYRVEG